MEGNNSVKILSANRNAFYKTGQTGRDNQFFAGKISILNQSGNVACADNLTNQTVLLTAYENFYDQSGNVACTDTDQSDIVLLTAY